jgi:hypothetical protein
VGGVRPEDDARLAAHKGRSRRRFATGGLDDKTTPTPF